MEYHWFPYRISLYIISISIHMLLLSRHQFFKTSICSWCLKFLRQATSGGFKLPAQRHIPPRIYIWAIPWLDQQAFSNIFIHVHTFAVIWLFDFCMGCCMSLLHVLHVKYSCLSQEVMESWRPNLWVKSQGRQELGSLVNLSITGVANRPRLEQSLRETPGFLEFCNRTDEMQLGGSVIQVVIERYLSKRAMWQCSSV